MNAQHQCNQVTVVGIMESDFAFSHDFSGEKFYTATLAVERMSGTKDYLPITVSEKLIDSKCTYVGHPVCVIGQFRSYNQKDGTHKHLILNIFAQDFYITAAQDMNDISLQGYLCKIPTYRVTPKGRQIADLMLAIPRPNGKSDYIPCVLWGRDAVFASQLIVGTQVSIDGRIQSREYTKMVHDVPHIKTAFEVSISKIQRV